jgi:protein TonB
MLNVLLESRAPRPRRVGVTLVSALMHGTLAAAAIALTLPHAVDANPAKQKQTTVVYLPIPKRPEPAQRAAPPPKGSVAPEARVAPNIQMPKIVPSSLPAIDVGPTIPPDDIRIGAAGSRIGDSGTIPAGSPLDGEGVLDERAVDRVPRLIGPAASPRYPTSLRDAGVQGHVLVQFVIDTLGRAELDGLTVVETAHPLFAESVRSALSGYRFLPGEAAGRKVRTRVQLPFEFTLTR